MEFSRWFSVFFFNDTATTEIYTLSLHDALPISAVTTSASPSPSAPARAAASAAAGSSPAARRSCSASMSRRVRSEEHTSELQSPDHLVCRLLLEKKKKITATQSAKVRQSRPWP